MRDPVGYVFDREAVTDWLRRTRRPGLAPAQMQAHPVAGEEGGRGARGRGWEGGAVPAWSRCSARGRGGVWGGIGEGGPRAGADGGREGWGCCTCLVFCLSTQLLQWPSLNPPQLPRRSAPRPICHPINHPFLHMNGYPTPKPSPASSKYVMNVIPLSGCSHFLREEQLVPAAEVVREQRRRRLQQLMGGGAGGAGGAGAGVAGEGEDDIIDV